MVNRTRSDITVEVLQSLQAGPMLSTYVMYSSKLSYTQLKYYERFLSENRLIEKIDGRWTITEKGREYLRAWDQVKEVLESS